MRAERNMKPSQTSSGQRVVGNSTTGARTRQSRLAALLLLSFAACADLPEQDHKDVVRVQGAVRNGILVTPFGPNPAPAETKNIVRVGGGCTGTVVAPSWVLSATHCALYVGALVESIRPTGTVTRTVDRVVDNLEANLDPKNAAGRDFTMLHLNSSFSDLSGAALFYGNTGDIVGQNVDIYGYGGVAATYAGCTSNAQCLAGQYCVVGPGICITATTDQLTTGNVATSASDSPLRFKTLPTAAQQMGLPGDSGGPTFFQSKLAGLNSWWTYDLSGGGTSSLPANRDWILALINDVGEDIVLHNSFTGETRVWRMRGTMSISNTGTDASLATGDSTGWQPVARADFNKDGLTDILWHKTSGELQVWFMSGATRLSFVNVSSTLNVPDSTGWRVMGTADFNRDGSPDIVWRNEGNGADAGAMQVWYMSGVDRYSATNLDPVLTRNTLFSAGWTYVGTGDFNQDGKVDILWNNSFTGAFQVWYMDGLSRTGFANWDATLNVPITSGWRPVGVADMNHDGKPDLLRVNNTTGVMDAWFMNNAVKLNSGGVDRAIWAPAGSGWGVVRR